MHPRKKNYALGLIPTLLLLLALIVSSCGGDAGTPQTGDKAPADQQIYRNALAGIEDIGTLDPAVATTSTSLDPIAMVFTGLVSFDKDLNVIPELAAALPEISSDGLTYTFKLRPGLKFSNGDPLTSKDVAFSVDRALSKDVNSPSAPSYLNLLQDWEKRYKGDVKTLIGTTITTPDDTTVTFKLNKPAGYFLATLTYASSYVVNQKVVDKYGKEWTDHIGEGAGSGPFTIKEYVHGQKVIFEPNPNYAHAKPQLKQVITTFIKDADTAYKSYQNDEIDVVGVPSVNLDEAKALKDEYYRVPVLSTFYYAMNYLAKPFDNVNIRKAFALALNKELINNTAHKGVRVPTNNIVPKGMPGYFEGIKGVEGASIQGDPTKAKELFEKGLKEAGYANASKLPTINFKYQAGSKDLENEVTIAANQWKEVLGVNVKLTPVDFEVLSTEQNETVGNDKLQMWYAGWGADYPDAQDFLTLLFDKGSPNNAINFGQNKSATADIQAKAQETMRKADLESDQAKRLQMYNEAEQVIVDNAAWIPIYQMARSRLLKTYVKGRTFTAKDSIAPQEWAAIYIASH